MQHLPWPEHSFDVVTGFHSFFLAADMVAALREARRVTRPGGTLALTVWGRPERCDSTGDYADGETLARGMLAAPPGCAARRATSAEAVRAALRKAAQPRLSDTGAVRLREEVRYLIATA